jgi:hypothetical protein
MTVKNKFHAFALVKYPVYNFFSRKKTVKNSFLKVFWIFFFHLKTVLFYFFLYVFIERHDI